MVIISIDCNKQVIIIVDTVLTGRYELKFCVISEIIANQMHNVVVPCYVSFTIFPPTCFGELPSSRPYIILLYKTLKTLKYAVRILLKSS
jgi:hypothetical protein